MLSLILGWFLKGPFDRILSTIDSAVNNETQRDAIKADVAKTYVTAQANVLSGRGWFFPLFFIAPAGFWFAAVCLYSVLWCRQCAYPQPWTIATLPHPLDTWIGAIVGSLFVGSTAKEIIRMLK